MKKRRVIPVLVVLVLIVIVGTVTAIGLMNDYRTGSTEVVDLTELYELSEDEYYIVMNMEVLTETTDGVTQVVKAVESDGSIYIDAQTIADTMNDSFYWDSNEKIFIYTKATQVIKAYPDETFYLEGSETVTLDYAPIRTINGEVYVAFSYVQMFTQCEIDVYTDPNRIVITTEWGEMTQVTITKNTVMRYTDPCDDTDSIDLQHEVVQSVAKDDVLTVAQSDEDWNWTQVITQDGLLGWVLNQYVGEETTYVTTAPDFEEETFTYLLEEGTVCLAWHQVTSTSASTASALSSVLSGTQEVTVIAPTWFCFDGTEGNVSCIATTEYVTYAHEQGLKVWAVFQNSAYMGGSMDGTNTDSILAYTSKRETLINELIAYVLAYDIDGINLDFESILEDGADNYIQFVRELSVACRNNGITLSIDNYVPLYTQYYDREEQMKFADYLVIMGYDEYGSFSTEAGPVASLEYVQTGIEDTLELIGEENSYRVINGIPFYTVVWNETVPYEDTVTMSEAKAYLEKYPDSTVVTWNAILGYNYGYYTSELNGVTYSMWLEDDESIAAKLELMTNYDLAGVAVWKLGQEDEDVWDAIAAYVTGTTIPTHDVLLQESETDTEAE